MQFSGAVARQLPLPPSLAEVEAGAESKFANTEGLIASEPTFRQAVSGQENVAAFEPAIGLAIKMVAKGQGIGHIPVAPVERCMAGSGSRIVLGMCHERSR